jgi:ribonuclease BN (tRNA processing enzyme)
MLIDCGSDIRFSLQEADIPLGNIASEIDAVYISHLHSDHIGGVETIALSAYFSPGHRKPKLFAEEKLIRRLWLHSLKGGLQCIQGRCMELEDYFECRPVSDSGSFIWEGIKFRLMKMPHIQSGQKDHDSYGLIMEEHSEGANVFFTADTRFRPELIKETAKRVDIIFHDCETSPFKTGVHAHYDELCTLPEDVKRKIWLYHYQPDPVYNPEADGFRGFVIKGQEFEIKHTSKLRR